MGSSIMTLPSTDSPDLVRSNTPREHVMTKGFEIDGNVFQ